FTPVALPPVRARLATRPSLTGSSATPKIMGIVVVAALAANALALPPVAQIGHAGEIAALRKHDGQVSICQRACRPRSPNRGAAHRRPCPERRAHVLGVP